MAGATSGVLRLSNLGTANAGAYDVVVTNAYGSITSSVATLVVQLLRPAILSQGAGFSAGHFGFDVSGPAGLVVAVEASTDFTDWVPLQTSALINGQAHFTDPATALTPQRFYRAHFVYGTSPQPVLQVPAATPPSSAQFGFYVDALPGQQISIQASTNLVDWTAAGTYTLLTGYYFYTNPAVAGLPARFYRATAQ